MGYWDIVKGVLFCKQGLIRIAGAIAIMIVQFAVLPKFLADKVLLVASTICFLGVMLLITSLSVEITNRVNAQDAENRKEKQQRLHGKKK